MSDVAPGWALSKAEELLRQADPRAANNGGGNVAVWILKAFASYIVEQRPADIPTELQPRVVALLRRLASAPTGMLSWHSDSPNAIEARAIVAELPKPPDPLLEEARAIITEVLAKKVYRTQDECDLAIALAALRRGVEIRRGGE